MAGLLQRFSKPYKIIKALNVFLEMVAKANAEPVLKCPRVLLLSGKGSARSKGVRQSLLIHRFWKAGTNPNRIADKLNKKKIPGRNAPTWNRNSVVLILKRFEDGIISIKGEEYELR